ncbi:hypothetical protein [Oleisolibacter albus]|uniref:hypothetical protein n=1 Tax=Oleisolibacter albus TaxID=2171757 RepID=UPI000DF205E7|nr:hypothetical protein [Oleisolibacter albus]
MPSVTTIVRKTPASNLRQYFDARGIVLPPAVNWDGPEGEIVRPLLRAVDELDPETRARIANDVERVGEMADEAGEAALYSVAPDTGYLDALPNAYARALWMFVNEAELFRRAEEVRYTDDRRHGRMWDGFVATPNLEVRRDAAALEVFKDAVRQRFESPNVQVDVFDRHRPTFVGDDRNVVQVTVYREGRPDDFLEFVDGALDRRPRRPVFEAALTYEPETGVIEVVARDRESRPDLVRLFARDLLATEFREERLPLRRFDLSVLSRPCTFDSDEDDEIAAVRVNHLRLMPFDTNGERITLECMRGADTNIWEMAARRLGDADPLQGGWTVTQAKLTIRFHPEPGSNRGKTLPLTITMPHGCDLKDRTERERLIGEKYLRRWGIVRDV